MSPEQFDSALASLERGVAASTATSFFALSYADVSLLANDVRRLFDHVWRFIVMSAAISSAYLALLSISYGATIGASKLADATSRSLDASAVSRPISLGTDGGSWLGEAPLNADEQVQNATALLQPLDALQITSPREPRNDQAAPLLFAANRRRQQAAHGRFAGSADRAAIFGHRDPTSTCSCFAICT